MTVLTKKTTRKILCLLLCAVLCLSVPLTAAAQAPLIGNVSLQKAASENGNAFTDEDFDFGDEDFDWDYEEIPVSTKEELSAIRDNLSGSYYLTNDIVFTAADFAEGGAFYNDGALWQPIGSSLSPFTGSLNGGGYTISGLQIRYQKALPAYLGLFGCNEGYISDLYLEDCDFCATSLLKVGVIGGIAGRNAGLIVQSGVSGTFESADTVGGIVGENMGVLIVCAAEGTVVSRRADAGGVVGETKPMTYYGETYESAVGGSFFCGSVTAGSMAGGIVGRAQESTTVLMCGSDAAVSSTSADTNGFAGGVVGCACGQIIQCYFAGTLSADTAGALVGTLQGGVLDACSYPSRCGTAVGAASAPYAQDTLYACSDELLRTEDAYPDFDFFATWMIDPDSDYPYPVITSHEICAVEVITPQNEPLQATIGSFPDLTDVRLCATRDDGAVKEIPVTAEMLIEAGYNPGQPGHQALYVGINGAFSENPLTVDVLFEEGTTMTYVNVPQGTTVKRGESVWLWDGTVLITYPDGTTEEFVLCDAELLDFDGNTAGVQTATVWFGGLTLPLEIEVLDGLYGDINGDDVFDIKDVHMSYCAASGVTVLTEQEIFAGDMDGDGEISVSDAMIAFEMVSGNWY